MATPGYDDSAPRHLRGEEGAARLAAARRAGQLARARVRAKNRRQDLDPAKRERDLAALDPATRRRVETYGSRTHL